MKHAAALFTVLMLSACSGAANDDGKGPDPVALVGIARAQQGPITQQITLYGLVEAGASGKQVLAAPADAIVARIVAPVGTKVATGDVIVQLSAAPSTKLDLAKAISDAGAADAVYARSRRLHADGLISDGEVEAARAAATSADAARDSLSGRAGALTLRALAPGYVQTIAVNPGELVTVGGAVATIGRIGDVRARFGADPASARQLRVGMPVRLEPSGGHPPLTLPIASVDPAVDPLTRLASVFVRLPADAGFAAGETLRGSAGMGSAGAALSIPYVALLDDGGQPFVYVVTGGIAHRHDVSIGAADGDRIAVLKGIGAGDQVVTQGGTALEDGMKVRVR